MGAGQILTADLIFLEGEEEVSFLLMEHPLLWEGEEG